MMLNKLVKIFSLVLTFAIAGCGGGNETFAGIDAGGTPAPVVSIGTISGFGSVIVNGVRYDTASATITVEGSSATQSDLKVGHVVVVHGTLNSDGITGSATSISFDDLVEGPIGAIDPATGTITVLSQLVIIDADTSFDITISPPSIEGLAVGDVVEVSGFFLADGSINATRIEKKAAGGEFEVTGLVSNLSGTTFQINDLVVDFSGAQQLDNFPAGTPEDGQLVEAKGTLGASDELLATRVEFKGNDLLADEGDRIEIEGFITRFASAADFDVDGVPVSTIDSTVYENGSEADLDLNRKVEVEGTLDANGVVVAAKVEFKRANFIRIEGLVEAVSGSVITIFGVEISVDVLTRFEDQSAVDLEIFSIDDIGINDYLETRGYEDGTGVIATIVERRDFRGEVAIRGFVDDVLEPGFTILEVLILTGAGTAFSDNNEQPIAAGAFFAQALGRLVEGRGSLNNGGILATEVELEN
ncbi:MAG: hypothetical protein IH911_03485 [Proteobacteria bacterium]|nr:hypothetical protein [Pseudomonadota bacterium]